jgi:hypothetical protein
MPKPATLSCTALKNGAPWCAARTVPKRTLRRDITTGQTRRRSDDKPYLTVASVRSPASAGMNGPS